MTSGGGLTWGYGCHGGDVVAMGWETGGVASEMVGVAGCCAVVAVFFIVVVD